MNNFITNTLLFIIASLFDISVISFSHVIIQSSMIALSIFQILTKNFFSDYAISFLFYIIALFMFVSHSIHAIILYLLFILSFIFIKKFITQSPLLYTLLFALFYYIFIFYFLAHNLMSYNFLLLYSICFYIHISNKFSKL
jgi:hypothetical protein